MARDIRRLEKARESLRRRIAGCAIPVSVYRLQLSRRLTLSQAEALVPYRLESPQE